MAELQVLFHNPESLSDNDLSSIRNKIRIHKTLQYGTGAAAVLIGMRYTKTQAVPMLGAFFLTGYFAGNTIAKMINVSTPWALSQDHDTDIMKAFEQRYANKSLNLAGYGNNSLLAANNISNASARYKKPYWERINQNTFNYLKKLTREKANIY